MATRKETIAFILDQIGGAGEVSVKAMFGEYGVYCDGKFVALVCDDQFYIKPTDAGHTFAPDLPLGTPYPNAKPHPRVDGDLLEDADWISDLVRLTSNALPTPRPRKRKQT